MKTLEMALIISYLTMLISALIRLTLPADNERMDKILKYICYPSLLITIILLVIKIVNI
jgi:hypothetical protein